MTRAALTILMAGLVAQVGSLSRGPMHTSPPSLLSGAQTFEGPFTITSATAPAIAITGTASGSDAIELPTGARICLDGSACTRHLFYNVADGYINAANIRIVGNEYINGNAVIAGTLNLQSDMINPGANYGGSVGISDPLRFLPATGALLESNTTPTAGIDTAFTLNVLSTLAATDTLIDINNNGVNALRLQGSGNLQLQGLQVSGVQLGGGQVYTYNAQPLVLVGNQPDGATAIGVRLKTPVVYSTAGAKFMTVENSTGGEKYSIAVGTHELFTGTAPAVGTGAADCGTSPTIAGNDSVGRVVVGTAPGSKCTLTFSVAWGAAPVCEVFDETTATALRPSATTSALAINGTFSPGDALTYRCAGY